MSFTPEPDVDYLNPTFEPSSVTVPRLRSILVEHGVQYPASAKKPQLIDLFKENVAPKTARLRSSRSRTKRSTRGIRDVASSHASTISEEESSDAHSMPLPTRRSPVKRITRRTTRSTTMENLNERFMSEPLPVRSPSKRGSAKHARDPDAESDEPPTARKTRRSATPAIKSEESEPEAWHRHDADSPFSSDNPFQSGSPVPEPASTRRRKTTGLYDHREKRTVARRRTDYHAREQLDGDIVPPSAETFEMSMTPIKTERPSTPPEIEPGEEFTPEEQLQLTQEQATGHVVLPPRQTRASRRSNPLGAAVWAISLAVLAGVGFVWRQEKLEVGYCGIGRPSASLAGAEIPEWADMLRPECEPCPPHAFCYEHLKINCEDGFILRAHPLSLGGLIPLPPTCEPDSDRSRRIHAVADKAVEELRDHNAKWECRHTPDSKTLEGPGVGEEDLKRTISSKKRRGMSQEEFEELWKGAIGEIASRDEITTTTNETTGERVFASNSLARIPISCAIKRSIRLALVRHLRKLVATVLVVAAASYAYLSITYSRRTEESAKYLASRALDKLTTRASLHVHDPRVFPENWISMGQLRDDILRDEFSASRRAKLWDKVQKKVEQNSNVRSSVREGRSGEVSRVWEWIGAIGAIEDSPGGTSRTHYGPRPSLEGLAEKSSAGLESAGKHEIKEMKAWSEGGRPVY